jgi:hypothetical protein
MMEQVDEMLGLEDQSWESYAPKSKMLSKRAHEFQWTQSRESGDVVVSLTHHPTKTTMRAFGHSEELVKKLLWKLMDEIFVALEAQVEDPEIQKLLG